MYPFRNWPELDPKLIKLFQYVEKFVNLCIKNSFCSAYLRSLKSVNCKDWPFCFHFTVGFGNSSPAVAEQSRTEAWPFLAKVTSAGSTRKRKRCSSPKKPAAKSSKKLSKQSNKLNQGLVRKWRINIGQPSSRKLSGKKLPKNVSKVFYKHTPKILKIWKKNDGGIKASDVSFPLKKFPFALLPLFLMKVLLPEKTLSWLFKEPSYWGKDSDFLPVGRWWW